MDKNSENVKKQIILRLSPTLWNDINQWAEDDFRSINGQIEFILNQAIKKRKGQKDAGDDEYNPLREYMEKI